MRLKVTDGDLLLVKHDSNMTEAGKKMLNDTMLRWMRAHNLLNVECLLVGTSEKNITFAILSVNDVFEEQVLKGDKNG